MSRAAFAELVLIQAEKARGEVVAKDTEETLGVAARILRELRGAKHVQFLTPSLVVRIEDALSHLPR
jgi:hypothetical protein